ncbi:MAG TPA: U32 family peptidase [Deltaproteobacteria bacterium]|nr:U32 family peptidase [Deltaproteobacteria bacterium]
MTNNIYKPELLAPAGSLESFFAAMESGADAIYAGLQSFSARARARNFSLSQMERMLAYAHSLDRRIYITLNTLVKEAELPQLVDTLAALTAMRADGLIVQDMAVARLVHKHFPTLPLHASTQMTVHNLPGVQALKQLGFTRVVLARELALDEVTAITAASNMEIETFVHGALCFSISGQCFFSSYLGGHSGNRGRCAQPCRRLYSHRGKQGHFFSTSDLSAIEMVPDLARAGVRSLKIEGRMKSAEYVASVVQAYRTVLDAPEQNRKQALAKAKELLKYSFGRTPTKGFLASQQPDDIANPWQKGGTGRFVGQIKSMHGKRLTFETRDAIAVGDRLRAQPKSDMAGQAWTVRELFCSRRKVMEAKAGSLVEVECPFHFSPGDAVYKVSSREAFTMSENACNRRLDAVKTDRIACRLTLSLQSDKLKVQAQAGGLNHEFSYHLGELEPSRSVEMQAFLQTQFAKCGESPFRLESLDAPGFPSVLIPAAAMKQIRTQFYAELNEAVNATFRKQVESGRRAAQREIAPAAPHGNPSAREHLTIMIDQPREWRFPLQNGADSVALPLTRANMHQLGACVPRMRGSEGRIIWQLPFMIFDRDLPLYRDTLRQLHNAGFRHFEIANISHLQLLKKLDGVHISAWYRCFSLNSQAILAWHELGVETVTLYPEDDNVNLGQLLQSHLPARCRVIAYGPLPVMTTKIKMKEVHSNTPLLSDRGESYHVISRDGLQTIYAGQPFSLTQRHAELRQKGCGMFLLDLTQTPREGWMDVIAAFKSGRSIEGTTEFNYPMELV